MAPTAEPEKLVLSDVVLQRRDADGGCLRILEGVDFTAAPGERIGLSGPSGAGKTSLLAIASGLLPPTSGTVSFGQTKLTSLGPAARDRWRAQMVGFVFQDFHLVPELSIVDNLLLPCAFHHWRAPPRLREDALGLIERLELPVAFRRTGVLSRGEQQRVAIGRALLREPRLIVADEPTASLDASNAKAIGELLVNEAIRCKATLLVASHDRALLERMEKTLVLRAGRMEPSA